MRRSINWRINGRTSRDTLEDTTSQFVRVSIRSQVRQLDGEAREGRIDGLTRQNAALRSSAISMGAYIDRVAAQVRSAAFSDLLGPSRAVTCVTPAFMAGLGGARTARAAARGCQLVRLRPARPCTHISMLPARPSTHLPFASCKTLHAPSKPDPLPRQSLIQ